MPNLLNVLKHTYSPDPAHRKQAEVYLAQYATQPNFPGMLLQVVTQGGADAQGVRLARHRTNISFIIISFVSPPLRDDDNLLVERYHGSLNL